jgi:hypothetical protein
MLNEMSWVQKDKYNDIHMWNLKQVDLIKVENRMVFTRGWER